MTKREYYPLRWEALPHRTTKQKHDCFADMAQGIFRGRFLIRRSPGKDRCYVVRFNGVVVGRSLYVDTAKRWCETWSLLAYDTFPVTGQFNAGCTRCGMTNKCNDPGHCPYGFGNRIEGRDEPDQKTRAKALTRR
jgi:hypothetical protein